MRYFTIEPAGTQGEFIMSGALTIDNAAAIRARLIDIFKKTDRIAVSINEESEIDVSFLQLLCSAHRTAMESEKSFVLDGAKSKSLIHVAEEAGYARKTGCSFDKNGNCLLISGG